MKLNGFVGKGSGKLGSSVFAISGGEQIVREYNPRVANPNTDAQVAQRAKMKLMSQLAAALALALAFKKTGLVSARNQFVSKNIGLCDYEDGAASVNYEMLQLTNGNQSFPVLVVGRDQNENVTASLATNGASVADRVIYVLFEKSDNAGENTKLVFKESKVVTEAGEGGTFPATLGKHDAESVIYAYGMKDLNAKATAKYEDYTADINNDAATLDVIRNLVNSDYNFTKTSGTTLDVI